MELDIAFAPWFEIDSDSNTAQIEKLVFAWKVCLNTYLRVCGIPEPALWGYRGLNWEWPNQTWTAEVASVDYAKCMTKDGRLFVAMRTRVTAEDADEGKGEPEILKVLHAAAEWFGSKYANGTEEEGDCRTVYERSQRS